MEMDTSFIQLEEELNGCQRPLWTQSSTNLNGLVQELRPVIEDADTASATVSKVLDQWALSSPDIIVVFVGGTRSFSSWKNQDHRAAFQKGIIKLLNAMDTWIIDSGLDYGVSRLIGEAVRHELQFRQLKTASDIYVQGHLKNRLNDIVLMGVVPICMSLQKPKDEEVTAEDIHEATTEHPEKLNVNPMHTHFMFVKGAHDRVAAVRSKIIREMVNQASARKYPDVISKDRERTGSIRHEKIPLIAVLIQGGPAALDMVYQQLKDDVPVLIIKETGFLANILAYALEEYRGRGSSRSSQYIIRRDVSKRVARVFPDSKIDGSKTEICNKIMECLGLADQKEKQLLSVVESSEDLVNLDAYLLPAIFSSRSSVANISANQVHADFLLTMKVNKPEIADSKVLGRQEQPILLNDYELFEKALLWNGREKFVERFMEQDFQLHPFLSHSRLLRLFRHAQDMDFFVTVVWHQIPRHPSDQSIEETFVTRDLNRIIEKLSGYSNFLSMHELSANCIGMFAKDKDDAERKAMNALIVWAVLMGRFRLTETFWKFCEDPIPVALFISALYRGLAQHCNDTPMASKLNEHSCAFSCKAIDILDMSYKESSTKTFDLLNQKFPDFNDRTPIKAAHLSHNKYFLAHEACQIWLNRLWGGGIEVSGSMESCLIPEEVKLILSALLLFPIPIWIHYPAIHFMQHVSMNDPDLYRVNVVLPKDIDYESAGGSENSNKKRGLNDPFHINPQDDQEGSKNTMRKLKKLATVEANMKSPRFQRSGFCSVVSQKTNSFFYMDNQIPFWKKVAYLWHAPRTKFWMFQVFYWVYLAIFSVAVIMPTCKNSGLDVVVLIWTAFHVIEIALRSMFQFRHDLPTIGVQRVLEIALITAFVVSVAAMKTYLTYIRVIYTRILMALGLLYMYYRMVTVFFPMNPVLGPLLYRAKRMILVDFVSFMWLSAPFILANMFVLQSVMYPDLPFGKETWRQGFYRSFFTLFTIFTSEIDYTQQCEAHRYNDTLSGDMCWVGDYSDYTCPTLGVVTYALNIQFWIILRLILLVILSASFFATIDKVQEDSENIFRYQRYATVLDFASRSALPPPLSIFSYLFEWTICCCARLRGMEKTRRRLVGSTMNKMLGIHEQRTKESYSYWMGLSKEYHRKKKSEELEKKIPQRQLARIEDLAEEQKVVRSSLAGFVEKLRQLEKSSLVYFKEIKCCIDNKGDSGEIIMNLLSRKSPYPKSSVKRTLLSDHEVSWENNLDDYNPPRYCKPLDCFPLSKRKFVDPEPSVSNSAFWCWNRLHESDGVLVDRRSYTESLEEQQRSIDYVVNTVTGLPRNIVGRTGLVGRGNLYRFGPNHCVQAILTYYEDDSLWFLTSKNSALSEPSCLFPVMGILDCRSPFLAAAQLVFSLFNTKTGIPDLSNPPENQEDMKKLMETGLFSDPDDETQSLSLQQIYSGYMDHEDNTDNAWMETIVFHVDILNNDGLARLKNENFSWKECGNIQRLQPFERRMIDQITLFKVVGE